MKKIITLLCAFALVMGMTATAVQAAKSDPVETKCSDGRDNDRDGAIDCADSDCFTDPACTDPPPPPPGDHSSLTWADYPSACLGCHNGGEAGNQYADMMASTHYKWVGEAPDMVNGVNIDQGKLTNAVNSYCINILGDWPVCGSCHAGRGMRPDDPAAGPENVDCLMCHSEEYSSQRTRLPDGSMGVAIPTDSMVQNVTKPTRANCLKCHAYAGGGNGVKRGDISKADASFAVGSDNNTDPDFDVHMNVAASNVLCQDCHVFQNHKTIGKGSDLRPTDDLARGAEVSCVTCHPGMDSGGGHVGSGAARGEGDRHVARVSCQACHIDVYAKNPTEIHRDWTHHHDGTPADGVSGPGHPHTEKAANLIPKYEFWNRLSDNALLGDDASRTAESPPYPEHFTGLGLPVPSVVYPTSRPMGDISDGKLYPFKYKTAYQPMTTNGNVLVALDTLEYLKLSGDVVASIESGLTNQGFPINEPYEWVYTDTLQLLNHGVATSPTVDCAKCHGNMKANLDPTTDSMLDARGYKLKAAASLICSQCHAEKTPRSHERMHTHISKGSGIGCYFCHDVARPERGLCSPCDPACVSEFVDTNPYDHVCPEPNY